MAKKEKTKKVKNPYAAKHHLLSAAQTGLAIMGGVCALQAAGDVIGIVDESWTYDDVKNHLLLNGGLAVAAITGSATIGHIKAGSMARLEVENDALGDVVLEQEEQLEALSPATTDKALTPAPVEVTA